MTLAERIAERLNRPDAVDAGASCADARVDADCPSLVIFTYPAPVISGACVGTISTFDDGRVHDETSDATFPDYESWELDLINMISAEYPDEYNA